ncbi:hypothetical protein FD755_015899, partial [Muntiacus reevesi]
SLPPSSLLSIPSLIPPLSLSLSLNFLVCKPRRLERCAPSVNDFLYICNDIYKRDEMLAMEASILKILKFDINIPIAYHFLRRYARCVYASMKTLTLSRFICELTLLEYDYVQERASKLAAASFFLALCMNELGHWLGFENYESVQSIYLFYNQNGCGHSSGASLKLNEKINA